MAPFALPTTILPRPISRLTTVALKNTNRREEVGEMDDQLWWLNRPMCLEWPEKADETPNGFRWHVEVVQGIHDALAPTRASELRAKRRNRRRRGRHRV